MILNRFFSIRVSVAFVVAQIANSLIFLLRYTILSLRAEAPGNVSVEIATVTLVVISYSKDLLTLKSFNFFLC